MDRSNLGSASETTDIFFLFFVFFPPLSKRKRICILIDARVSAQRDFTPRFVFEMYRRTHLNTTNFRASSRHTSTPKSATLVHWFKRSSLQHLRWGDMPDLIHLKPPHTRWETPVSPFIDTASRREHFSKRARNLLLLCVMSCGCCAALVALDVLCGGGGVCGRVETREMMLGITCIWIWIWGKVRVGVDEWCVHLWVNIFQVRKREMVWDSRMPCASFYGKQYSNGNGDGKKYFWRVGVDRYPMIRHNMTLDLLLSINFPRETQCFRPWKFLKFFTFE